MLSVSIGSFDSGMGKIHTAAADQGLSMISLPATAFQVFEKRLMKLFPDCELVIGGPINDEAERQIKKFLAGELKEFELPLNIRSGEFGTKVLKQVARIPYGQTVTYGEIARVIGHPKAFRAVGTAVGRNNLPIVVPCHRVVASKGLGGFAGGLRMKRTLLQLEGHQDDQRSNQEQQTMQL